MTTVFDYLFPQELLSISQNILKMKNKYDNSIPKLLTTNGYLKYSNSIYYNPIKKIILYYKKSNIKSNRQQAFQELINFNNIFGGNQLIYGYMNKSVITTDNVVLNNNNISIMSGETLLKYLLDNYDIIIINIRNEINDQLNPNEEN